MNELKTNCQLENKLMSATKKNNLCLPVGYIIIVGRLFCPCPPCDRFVIIAVVVLVVIIGMAVAAVVVGSDVIAVGNILSVVILVVAFKNVSVTFILSAEFNGCDNFKFLYTPPSVTSPRKLVCTKQNKKK